MLSADSWKALMQQQGLTNAVVAGEALPASDLLSKQFVVVGVSDGCIKVKRFKQKLSAQKQATPTVSAPVHATPAAVETTSQQTRLSSHQVDFVSCFSAIPCYAVASMGPVHV